MSFTHRNGVGVDLVQAKLSASDLINAYDYKATNQRYYPDLGRFTSSVWNFLARCSDVCFREGPPRRARTGGCLLRLLCNYCWCMKYSVGKFCMTWKVQWWIKTQRRHVDHWLMFYHVCSRSINVHNFKIKYKATQRL